MTRPTTSIFLMALAILWAVSAPAAAHPAASPGLELPLLALGENEAATALSDSAVIPSAAIPPLMATPITQVPAEDNVNDLASISPVPEPSSLVLGAWGIAILGYALRRRQLRRERQR